MDLITSVFTICGTVSETDRQYRVLAKKLTYELKKAEHLAENQKVKYVPKFMLENLLHKIQQAKEHLSKIEAILTQDKISLKQKIKLSLPFNKTLVIVKTCIEQLQKAQQDVNDYGNSTETENNGKRSLYETQRYQKKEQTMVSLIGNQEVNEEDIEEALMGPTVQEDAAIQFTRNKYVMVRIELCGLDKIINFIKELNEDFLVYKSKVHIKFQNAQKTINEIQLFSLGRVHFKPVYTKLKSIYADIDRISKQNHFVIKLKRQRVNVKTYTNQVQKIQEKKQIIKTNNPSNSESDQFFSFPCTGQQIVMKQLDTIVVQRSQQKNVYFSDSTGQWQKMIPLQKQIIIGEQIAPFIPLNKVPQIPDIYFKINFQIIQ